MAIKSFQLNEQEVISIKTKSSTLDDLTRDLPQGFYTTFNTLHHGEKVMGLTAHLQRLYGPANEVGLHASISETSLRSRLAEYAKKNLPGESRIRLILGREDGRMFVGIQKFEPLPDSIYLNGVQVITSAIIRHDPGIKDTGFILESAAQRKQVNQNVFEVLLTKDGKIYEGMTSNFYAVKGGGIITAKRGILPGVTRKSVLTLARGQGMSIIYRAPRMTDKFDEAFLTSSSRGVVPIVSIDKLSVGEGRPGKWTGILSKAYQAYIEERSEPLIAG